MTLKILLLCRVVEARLYVKVIAAVSDGIKICDTILISTACNIVTAAVGYLADSSPCVVVIITYNVKATVYYLYYVALQVSNVVVAVGRAVYSAGKAYRVSALIVMEQQRRTVAVDLREQRIATIIIRGRNAVCRFCPSLSACVIGV